VAAHRIQLSDPGADLEPLVAALVAGQTVVIPTDTVYGLACAAHRPEACERTLRLKARDLAQPTAILCASLATLFTTALPELFGHAGVRARRLLPGPVTLVVPNPSRRFRWLCGPAPDRIGVRVPELETRLAAAIDRVGPLLATSANLHGGPDPRSLDEVPPALLERVAVAVDGGRLPGTPSTVVDITGPEPVVLREGAVPAAAVLAALTDSRSGAAPQG
jgi:L-threonylcarbamoyladenylate synthase